MIYQIAIENFFSIADHQELNFKIDKNAPDLPCFKTSRSDGLTRLPVVVGFFGSNAAGKSTILRAMVAAILFGCHSFDWREEEIDVLFQAYRRKDWWGKPTKIVIEFDARLNKDEPSRKFRYELNILHVDHGFSNKVVSYEALYYTPKNKICCLFKREGQSFYFGNEFGISNKNDPRTEAIRPNASVISTLAKLNHPLSIFLSNQIRSYESNFIGFEKIQNSMVQWQSVYFQNPNYLERLNRELRRFDVGLESMQIEQSNNGLVAKFKHVGLDDFIFLPEESVGTQRFIGIFYRLYYVLETGSVAFIDELDTDLHPLLIPELLRWFNDPIRNPHSAQLFFTAHNPALLDELEKEQVFFATKTSGQPSQIYCASEIKGLRREPSLMRKYLNGELGAVPHIG